MKPFEPNFNTPLSAYSREELNKLGSNGMQGTLFEELRDTSKGDLQWEAEQLAKSYGIYLEFDRARSGQEKDWIYMLRVTIPGGGAIGSQAWKLLDDISNDYSKPPDGAPSLRLTTRQNVQFHWVRKPDLLPVLQRLATSGFNTLNGCGDNVRNVMACPLARFSDVFDANAWAGRVSQYFQLPAQPFIHIFEIDPTYVRSDNENTNFKYGPGLLNRKFKIAFTTVHRDHETGGLKHDNCVECLTNDVAISPVFQLDRLQGFQISIGGGQGERVGKPTMAALAKPFAFVSEQDLVPTLDAIVKVHQEWGDRENRHWARLKYVVKKQGMAWYQEKVQSALSFKLEKPLPDHDCGPRELHHGWCPQPSNGLLTYGAYIENGRIVDGDANGSLKSGIRRLVEEYPVELTITPNQDLLFNNIAPEQAQRFEADLHACGYGSRNAKQYSPLRLQSGSCVGKTTCRLAYTDSEQFEPILIDQLEALGWGHISTSIGITGCERQCYRPATKAIGLVGSGMNLYQLKLMGTEDGRHQGHEVTADGGTSVHLRAIPKDEVATVIDNLFKFYSANKQEGESVGYFYRRIGMAAIIEHLKSRSETEHLMLRTQPSNSVALL